MLKLLAKLKTSGNALKYTANVIFLSISCLLIANLLIQLSDESFIKGIFITVAIGLDIFRQYIVALAKFYWRTNLFISCALWFVYLIHVSVVLLASVGFSLSAIDAKLKTTETYNMERQSIIDNINSNEAEVKQLEPIKKESDINSFKYRQASQRIDALQKVNRGLYDQLKSFKEVKVNIDTDIYGTLGAFLSVQGKNLKLYMLFVLSCLIELALLVTSWDIKLAGTDNFINGEVNRTVSKTTRTDKICPECLGKIPLGARADAVFCSAKCRKNAFKKRQKGALVNAAI